MAEEPEDHRKFSVNEAMEALKKARIARDAAAGTPPAGAAPNKPAWAQAQAQAPTPTGPSFIAPQFWLDNLQDGVQRSRDKLFDSIAENPTAATGLSRRDFAPTESFAIPAGMLLEVGAEDVKQAGDEAESSPLRGAAVLDIKVLGEAGLIDEQGRYGEA